ncbi:MAG: ligase-associated DNA damage response endonuclease PdeM [Phycisphaeraceae bacterium]
MATATMRDTEVDLANHLPQGRLRLCPERAVWWTPDPGQRGGTLLIADPHLGKADLFRRRGIPVPHAAAEADLDRLSSLLERTAADRLIVLGDLLHSRPEPGDATVETVAAWRDRHVELETLLVRGNHDRHAGPPLEPWRMSCCDEPCVLEDLPFVLRHHPEDDDRGPVLCGHVHPAVTPRSGTREATLRMPCFHWEPGPLPGSGHATGRGRLTLPAFGGFTGTHRIQPAENDRVFAITETSVLELPPEMLHNRRHFARPPRRR